MAILTNNNTKASHTKSVTGGNGFFEGAFPLQMPESPYTPKEFHIDALKNAFRDLARPNQFKVAMEPPSVIEWDNSYLILAKSAVIPSIEIEEILWERAGVVYHIPSNKMNYGDVTVTFMIDDQYNIRSLFNIWQNGAVFNWSAERKVENQALTSVQVGPIVDTVWDGVVRIFAYNAKREPVYMVELTNAWPKSISEVSLSQESTDQVAEFSVTFAYTMQKIYTPGS